MSGEISSGQESGTGGEISHDKDVVEQPLAGSEQVRALICIHKKRRAYSYIYFGVILAPL